MKLTPSYTGIALCFLAVAPLAISGCGKSQPASVAPLEDQQARIISNIQNDATLTPAQKADRIQRVKDTISKQPKQ